MIDALLFAVRDAIRGAGFGYDYKTCEIMADGKPPPRCGDIFLSVHPGPSRSTALNYIDEMFSFRVTVTRKVTIPQDRVGDQTLVSKLARHQGPGTQKKSFTERCELLRAFLHMNWAILQMANNNLMMMLPDHDVVYGFSEPAHYAGMDDPKLIGPEWFDGEPSPGAPVGLISELKFDDCRRFQGIGVFA